ncbi:MAG: hypothetical protein Q8Q38_00980 [bacterium]|nr:hypothetical protein [bacterium]
MINQRKEERGVSLYIAVLIMTVLLAIGLGISSAFLSQIDTLRGVGWSVFAFNATDAGIERALFIDTSLCISSPTIEDRINCMRSAIAALSLGDRTLSNGSAYELTVEAAGEGGCPVTDNYCAKSVGTYKEATRAIRISR